MTIAYNQTVTQVNTMQSASKRKQFTSIRLLAIQEKTHDETEQTSNTAKPARDWFTYLGNRVNNSKLLGWAGRGVGEGLPTPEGRQGHHVQLISGTCDQE